MTRVKNEDVSYKWKQFSSHSTQSEAKRLSIRLEAIKGWTTRVEYNEDLNEYFIMVLQERITKRINNELKDYE